MKRLKVDLAAQELIFFQLKNKLNTIDQLVKTLFI